jgi:hypothetical protein
MRPARAAGDPPGPILGLGRIFSRTFDTSREPVVTLTGINLNALEMCRKA